MATKTDLFTRLCIVGVLLLLTVNAGRPLVHTSAARVDNPPQYKMEVVDQGTGGKTEAAVQQVFQERTHDGWQLVAATVYHRDYPNAVGPVYVLVFRK